MAEKMSVINQIPAEIGQSLFQSQQYADVCFRLSDNTGKVVIIPAHKIYLAAKSTVFDRMFFGVFNEKGNVNITDVSAESFIEFLQIFNRTDLTFSSENIVDVLMLVDKYDVQQAYKVIIDFLRQTVTHANVWQYYEMALNSLVDLQTEFKCKILYNTKESMANLASSRVSAETIKEIISSDDLLCGEMGIFCGLMEWAKFEIQVQGLLSTVENLEAQLGDLLNLVRFPTMTVQQFLDCGEKYPGFLKFDVFVDILQHITNGRVLLRAKNFITKPRNTEKEFLENFPIALPLSRKRRIALKGAVFLNDANAKHKRTE